MDYLAVWDELKSAIEKAHSISDLKDLRNRAQLMRHALRMAGESEELIRKAETIKLRAERRAGEVLLQMEKAPPGAHTKNRYTEDTMRIPTYGELEINKLAASKWQRLAGIPEESFEQWLQTAEEISTAGALRFAKLRADWSGYHPATRLKQALHDDDVHHPAEKIHQIREFLPKREQPYEILELFAGGEDGNLSKVYREFGTVERYDKKLGTGDSFLQIHRLIWERKTFDVVDLDPYGFPSRMFPHVFQLMDDSFFFMTFPKFSVNITNRMNDVHQESYYGVASPSMAQVIERITSWGLCHWRAVEFLDSIEFAQMWRFAFRVRKVKATDYTGIVLK